MNQTKNYQLNQWDPEDPIRRTDFNEDNAKVDAALSSKADAAVVSSLAAAVGSQLRLVTGSYKGTGTYGADHPNVIEIPDAERPPRLILVLEARGIYRGIFIRGMTGAAVYWVPGNAYTINLTWTDKGVRWYSKTSSLDQLNNNTLEDGYCYAVFI